MANEPPRLPMELIIQIFSELAYTLQQPTPVSWRANAANPTPSFERSFKTLTLVPNLAGPAREVLFKTVHVGSFTRAKSLLQALGRSFLQPAWTDEDGKRHPAKRVEKYLTDLVRVLRVDIREREVGGPGPSQGASGITPANVKALAAALPQLATLDISCSDKGGWLDSEMISAFREFKEVTSMEIESTGFTNASSIFSELKGLEDLKLRALTHGFSDAQPFVFANARFLTLPRAPNPVLFGQHLKTLVLQRVVLDPATTLPLLFTTSGLNPAILENLVIVKLVAPPAQAGVPSFALPPDALQTVLQPYMANLRHFHLDLFDVPPVPSPGVRDLFKQQGIYRGCRIVLPDSLQRPGTFLAPSFGPHLHQLILGGPMNLDGARFFDQLSNSPARVQEITFSQCATNPHKAYVDGITPAEFIASLDTEWATALVKIDVKAMQTEFEDDNGNESPAWDWAAIVQIEAKLRELECSRKGGEAAAVKKIELLHSVTKPVERKVSTASSSKGKGKGKGKRARDEEETKPRKNSRK